MTRYTVTLTVALAMVAGFALSSCSKAPEAQVKGAWAADFLASLEDQDISDEERQMVEQMAENVSLTIEFAEDGTMTVAMTGLGDEDRTETGTWEVAGSEGNTVTIHTRKAGEDAKGEFEEIILTFESEDRFNAEFTGRMTVFNRQ